MKFSTAILAIQTVATTNAFGILGNVGARLADRATDKFVVQKELDKLGVSDETRKIIEDMPCAFSQFMIIMGTSDILDRNANAQTDEVLKTENLNLGWEKSSAGEWRKTKVEMEKEYIAPNWSANILLEEDLIPKEEAEGVKEKLTEILQDAVFKSIRNIELFPIVDYVDLFENDEQALRVMKELRIVEGEAMPISYNTNFDMKTDESFSRIFFHGIGAPLIAKQDEANERDAEYGPFVVDMPLQNLGVRDERFKGYGARIHFDEDQKPTAIYDYVDEKLVRPGDEGWDAAKMHAKVTAFALTTVREHLSWTHLIVSNDACREIVLHLHPEHPIRRLLALFTWNSRTVNATAFDALVPNGSSIMRTTPLTYDAIQDIFDDAYKTSIAYEPFTKREIKCAALEKLEKDGKFPYLTEGKEYYCIVENFVRDWLKNAGDEATDEYAVAFYEAMKKCSEGQEYELPSMEDNADAMVDLISTIIFTVTGYHEIIGHVVDYSVLPTRAGMRIIKDPSMDQTQVDLQSFLAFSIVSATTSLKVPQLLAEFPNYIGAGAPEWEREVWNKFLLDMAFQAKKVQQADRERDFEFQYFDPSLFENSVSV